MRVSIQPIRRQKDPEISDNLAVPQTVERSSVVVRSTPNIESISPCIPKIHDYYGDEYTHLSPYNIPEPQYGSREGTISILRDIQPRLTDCISQGSRVPLH